MRAPRWPVVLLLAAFVVLMLGCHADRDDLVAPPPSDTTIAVTAPAFSVWYVRLDTTWVGIYGFHLGVALVGDTLRIPVADTMPHVVTGYRLEPTTGRALCHDWHVARRGDVVTLWCERETSATPALGLLFQRRVDRRVRFP